MKMKQVIVLATAILSSTVATAADVAKITCDGKSDVVVSGTIEGIVTHGLPAVKDTAVSPMIPDTALHGLPPTTVTNDVATGAASGWNHKVECAEYKGKFWQWRIDKCTASDPKWVSPGLGKTLK